MGSAPCQALLPSRSEVIFLLFRTCGMSTWLQKTETCRRHVRSGASGHEYGAVHFADVNASFMASRQAMWLVCAYAGAGHMRSARRFFINTPFFLGSVGRRMRNAAWKSTALARRWDRGNATACVVRRRRARGRSRRWSRARRVVLAAHPLARPVLSALQGAGFRDASLQRSVGAEQASASGCVLVCLVQAAHGQASDAGRDQRSLRKRRPAVNEVRGVQT